MVVDITNDGQMSSTDPEVDLDPDTARVTGWYSDTTCMRLVRSDMYIVHVGGAHFEASFGPGRYRAFTCVDFKGDGYELVSSSALIRLADSYQCSVGCTH